MRWVAQPRQADFLLSGEYAVLYGGARGGGKTDALIAHAITVCMEHPGAKVLLLRRNFTDLSQPGAAIPRSQELIGTRASWNGGLHQWTFSNGSVFKFGHLSDAGAIMQYLGTQVDVLLLDQAEQLQYDEYRRLQGSVRATVPGLEPHIRLTANPGGIGHAWVKSLFIDAAPPNATYYVDTTGEEPIVAAEPDGDGVWQRYRFVPSTVHDNQELLKRDPGYVRRLQSTGGSLARAWLEGDWDQFEGQFFKEWRRNVHVIAPLPIPADWPRFHATDYGLSAPSCTLWAVRSPKTGRIFVYRERYERDKTADQQALKIKLWSTGEQFRMAVGDPSMWNRESTGRSIAQQFAQHGVGLAKATNDRPAGWAKLREYLAWTEQQPPKLQVFSTCTNLVRTLPAMVHDPITVEDLDTDGEDHAVDALRYLVMAIDVTRTKRLEPTPWQMGRRKAA